MARLRANPSPKPAPRARHKLRAPKAFKPAAFKVKAKPPAAKSAKAASRRHARKAPSGANLTLRLSVDALDLISTAAALEGKTRTEFMLDSARRNALEALLDRRLFHLDEAQHEAFMAALDNPPKPSPALRELMSAPSPWDR